MSGRHVVMPGGSGFLGRHLRDRLVDRGDRVTVLTRGAETSGTGWRSVHWDGRTMGEWARNLEGADVIVHLSGKRVDCPPTRRNIAELISSRVEPVVAVGRAFEGLERPPPVWVQLSSLAIYGEGGDVVIDETTIPTGVGPPQMVQVCLAWEAAWATFAPSVDRAVLLRPGIGLGGTGDPATERLVWLARRGLGGRVGSGRQWVSWIALEDFTAILLRAVDDPAMSGLYHVTAPEPVRNADMMAAYRRAVGRRFGLSGPGFITQIGARLLGSDPALALTGRRAVPKRLLEEGYEFQVPVFEDAVARAVAGR